MWIVFGWEKEERPVAEVANAYCYDCRRKTLWFLWNESEWVTFSDIRTLRFINKHRLHCASCTFFLELSAGEVGTIKRHMKTHDSIDGTPLHENFVRRIETSQLEGKTPKQLKFIRESMEAEREYAERMREAADREA
jgi:hypothetical protein